MNERSRRVKVRGTFKRMNCKADGRLRIMQDLQVLTLYFNRRWMSDSAGWMSFGHSSERTAKRTGCLPLSKILQ